MELHYHWTREDIAADIKWAVRLDSPWQKKIRRMRNIFAAVLLVIGALMLWSTEGSDGFVSLFMAAAFFVGYLPLAHVLQERARKRAYDQTPGDLLFCERTLTLDNDTLKFQTPARTISYPRKELAEVLEAPHAVYLRLRDGTLAMIPNSAFSGAERDEFLSALKK